MLGQQSCWNARVARDVVDVGIKRGRCGNRVAGMLELLGTLWT
jgi:hypothetical protein